MSYILRFSTLGLFLLAPAATATAFTLVGDQIDIAVEGVAAQNGILAVNGGAAEASFTYGSDESIEFDFLDTSIDVTFIDFTNFWAWSPGGSVGPDMTVDITDIDVGAAITGVTVTGSFFDGLPISAQVVGPSAISFDFPEALDFQDGPTAATINIALMIPEPTAGVLSLVAATLLLAASRRHRTT